MGYYRRRSYRTWRTRGSYTPSKYTVLARIFGSTIEDIRQAFLALEDDALDDLLKDYGVIHGAPAERYARNTFPNWKTGYTKLSGQTMERLVELVPPYLEPDQRIAIVKKLIKFHKPRRINKPKKIIYINIELPGDAFQEIENAFEEMRVTDTLAHVPEHVMKAANWLYDDDVTAARSVIAESVQHQNEIMKQSARREVDLLKRTISSGQIKSATYTVDLPAGSIEIKAYTPPKSFFKTVMEWLK